jgi:hypothetical protein
MNLELLPISSQLSGHTDMKYLFVALMLVGCSTESNVDIPEPLIKEIPKENKEMVVTIQMSGGKCIEAKSIYKQITFLGDSNVYGVNCFEYGTTDNVTYIVDKNLNKVTK